MPKTTEPDDSRDTKIDKPAQEGPSQLPGSTWNPSLFPAHYHSEATATEADVQPTQGSSEDERVFHKSLINLQTLVEHLREELQSLQASRGSELPIVLEQIREMRNDSAVFRDLQSQIRQDIRALQEQLDFPSARSAFELTQTERSQLIPITKLFSLESADDALRVAVKLSGVIAQELNSGNKIIVEDEYKKKRVLTVSMIFDDEV